MLICKAAIEYSDIKKEKAIGEGGFATVWKARWNDNIVAYKEWKPEIAMNADQMTLFQREVEVNRYIIANYLANNCEVFVIIQML